MVDDSPGDVSTEETPFIVEVDEDSLDTAMIELRADAVRRGSNVTATDVDRAVARLGLNSIEAAFLALRLEQDQDLAPRRRGPSTGPPTEVDDADPLTEVARRYPLLSAAEEVQLARAIGAGELAQSSLVAATHPPIIERQLQTEVARGLEARDRFVGSNVRLAIAIARRYQGRGLDLADLVQEGMLGLMVAVGKFDWRLGYKFSTYATWWIRQAITRALADKGRAIRLPVHVVEKVHRVRKYELELGTQLGRPATLAEVADACGLDGATVAFLRDVSQGVLSLDSPINEDGTGLGAMVVGPGGRVDDDVVQRDLEKELTDLVSTLPEKQRDVVERRYGLNGHQPETLEAIGQRHGITRERVRQIQVKAERRLRALAMRSRPEEFVEEVVESD